MYARRPLGLAVVLGSLLTHPALTAFASPVIFQGSSALLDVSAEALNQPVSFDFAQAANFTSYSEYVPALASDADQFASADAVLNAAITNNFIVADGSSNVMAILNPPGPVYGEAIAETYFTVQFSLATPTWINGGALLDANESGGYIQLGWSISDANGVLYSDVLVGGGNQFTPLSTVVPAGDYEIVGLSFGHAALPSPGFEGAYGAWSIDLQFTAVPEPSAALLAALGLGCVAGGIWRQRRS